MRETRAVQILVLGDAEYTIKNNGRKVVYNDVVFLLHFNQAGKVQKFAHRNDTASGVAGVPQQMIILGYTGQNRNLFAALRWPVLGVPMRRAARRLRRSERLHGAKVRKRLVVCTEWLNTDVRSSGCKMRLDAIADPTLVAPCDNRID